MALKCTLSLDVSAEDVCQELGAQDAPLILTGVFSETTPRLGSTTALSLPSAPPAESWPSFRSSALSHLRTRSDRSSTADVVKNSRVLKSTPGLARCQKRCASRGFAVAHTAGGRADL